MSQRVRLGIKSVGGNIQFGVKNTGGSVGLGVGAKTAGVTDYNALTNKPKINGVTLVDDKSFEELGVDTLTNLEILSIFNRVFGG